MTYFSTFDSFPSFHGLVFGPLTAATSSKQRVVIGFWRGCAK